MPYLLSYISPKSYNLKVAGKIIKEIEWPEQRLSYPINNTMSAYYKHILFNAKKSEIRELGKQLNLDQNIVRHLIVKDVPENLISPKVTGKKPAKIDDKKLEKKLEEILKEQS